MGIAETALAVATVNFLSELIRVRMGKPEGWKPSPEDIANFVIEIEASTPEAMKAAARARLNLPTDVEPLRETPQAPV
jgi:hypothetical protein